MVDNPFCKKKKEMLDTVKRLAKGHTTHMVKVQVGPCDFDSVPLSLGCQTVFKSKSFVHCPVCFSDNIIKYYLCYQCSG